MSESKQAFVEKTFTRTIFVPSSKKKSRKRKHFLIKYLKLTFLWIRWLPLHGKNHTSKFKISTRIIIAIDVTVASRIGLLIRPADCFVYIPESADSHPYPHSNKEL